MREDHGRERILTSIIVPNSTEARIKLSEYRQQVATRASPKRFGSRVSVSRDVRWTFGSYEYGTQVLLQPGV